MKNHQKWQTHSGLSLTAMCLASFFTHAQSSSIINQTPDAAMESVEKITITSARNNRDINEIAANITTINAEQVDALSTTNIRDLFRYEPGVSVEGSGRFGLSNINIRGINGDRVLILLDDIPVADGFSFGPNLSSRRDFIDIDLIKGVEVIRGPASTLYGSDAIGGVVAFTSKDPIDFLDVNESFAARVKTGFASQSDESFINAQLVGATDSLQWLLSAGFRQANETESYFNNDIIGSDQQASNPLDSTDKNMLAKLIWSPNDEHRLTFIAETFNVETQSNITSDIDAVVFGSVNQTSQGDDIQERSRLSASYLYEPKNQTLSRVSLNAYTQTSLTEQYSFLERLSLADPSSGFSRTRDSAFEQQTSGILGQVDIQFSALGEHYLIAGLEWQTTDSEALREGQTFDLASGVEIPEFTVFPARDFPLSELSEFAIYVQDEIQFFDGALSISPGLRYDSFKLTPTSDAIFENANPGVEVATFDDSELSAKLGAIYKVSNDASLWLQYAQGFRIPPMDDLNIGFTNLQGGYTSLANPDLLPESVDSLELGWRQNFSNMSVSISAYQNKYENFIESLAVLGFNPATGLLEFQARNIEDVEIKGVDLSASYQMDMWRFRLATSLQDSEDKATGDELDSILPTQTVLGIQYGSIEDPWRIELVGTRINEATEFSATSEQAANFTAPSVTLVDILAHYQITEDTRVNAGIFNITDEQYWFASEVRGRTVDENLDRFTAPGVNFSANLIINF